MMLLRSKDASNIASKVRDDETDLGTMSARVLMQALPSTSNYLFNSVGLWDKRFLWNFSSNAAEKVRSRDGNQSLKRNPRASYNTERAGCQMRFGNSQRSTRSGSVCRDALLDNLCGDMLNTSQFIIKQSDVKFRSMRNALQNSYRISRRGASCVPVGPHRTNRLSSDGRNRGDLQHGHRSGCEPEG
jgi:hypothetical protein